MATKLDLVMQARKPTDIAIYGQFVIDDRGHLRVESSYINKVEVPSVIRFLTEWYSDPTPPLPDSATLRKAEMFEELVSEMTAANDELCGAVGSAVFGSGTILDAYQAFYARFAKSLAKAKAAKA